MKKIIITIFILNVIIVTTASAKALEGYGIRVGVNSSDQYFSYSDPGFSFDTERKSGINGGIFVEWKIKPSISIVNEIDYIQKGMKFTLHTVSIDESGEFIEGDEKLSNKVNYISFHILAKYRIFKNNFTPYIIVGPRIDYLLGFNTLYLNDIYGNLKKFMIGGSFGAGFEIGSNKPCNFIFEFRYDLDLADSYNNNLLKVKNNSYGISMGIKF